MFIEAVRLDERPDNKPEAVIGQLAEYWLYKQDSVHIRAVEYPVGPFKRVLVVTGPYFQGQQSEEAMSEYTKASEITPTKNLNGQRQFYNLPLTKWGFFNIKYAATVPSLLQRASVGAFLARLPFNFVQGLFHEESSEYILHGVNASDIQPHVEAWAVENKTRIQRLVALLSVLKLLAFGSKHGAYIAVFDQKDQNHRLDAYEIDHEAAPATASHVSEYLNIRKEFIPEKYLKQFWRKEN
jgi:hypothetical protein